MEVVNKWPQNKHNYSDALRENEILKADLKKIMAYTDDTISMLSCHYDVKASVIRGRGS